MRVLWVVASAVVGLVLTSLVVGGGRHLYVGAVGSLGGTLGALIGFATHELSSKHWSDSGNGDGQQIPPHPAGSTAVAYFGPAGGDTEPVAISPLSIATAPHCLDSAFA